MPILTPFHIRNHGFIPIGYILYHILTIKAREIDKKVAILFNFLVDFIIDFLIDFFIGFLLAFLRKFRNRVKK